MTILPLTGRAIRGRFAIVDGEIDHQWYYHPRTGTAYTRIAGAEIPLHRYVLPGEMIDHLNGWHLDNRRENLRVSSHAANSKNRNTAPNINRTRKGFKVRFSEVVLGYYETRELAETAHEEAAASFGYVTRKTRERLLAPVIEFLESKVKEGILKRHINMAPRIDDRYRIVGP